MHYLTFSHAVHPGFTRLTLALIVKACLVAESALGTEVLGVKFRPQRTVRPCRADRRDGDAPVATVPPREIPALGCILCIQCFIITCKRYRVKIKRKVILLRLKEAH